MSKKRENLGFQCEQCGAIILALTNGSYRNHCPYCLYSKHLDEIPGDRRSKCKGLMEPVELIYNTKKGYQIIHKCCSCDKVQKNIIAINTIQEDNIFMLLNAK